MLDVLQNCSIFSTLFWKILVCRFLNYFVCHNKILNTYLYILKEKNENCSVSSVFVWKIDQITPYSLSCNKKFHSANHVTQVDLQFYHTHQNVKCCMFCWGDSSFLSPDDDRCSPFCHLKDFFSTKIRYVYHTILQVIQMSRSLTLDGMKLRFASQFSYFHSAT